jgi:hypothetical protein
MRMAKYIWYTAIFSLAALLLFACALDPTPTDEQILQAVAASNATEANPLELVYEEMQVPHRYPGRAGAVLWVPDKSVQRNYSVAYDQKTDTFYIKSYITLVLGEDGVYREQR